MRLAKAGLALGAGLIVAGAALRHEPAMPPLPVHPVSIVPAVRTAREAPEALLALAKAKNPRADELIVILHGPPYRASPGGVPMFATPDTGLWIDVALALQHSERVVVLALNNPTPADVSLNDRYERNLSERIPALEEHLLDAREWMEQHPEQVITGLDRQATLDTLSTLIRAEDRISIQMTTHGNSEVFVPAMGEGGFRGVPFETLAQYLAESVRNSPGRKEVSLVFNQCGGAEIAERFLHALYEGVREMDEERFPQVTLRLTSANALPTHRINISDYQLGSLAMSLDGGDWQEYNALPAVSLYGSDMPLFQGNIPGNDLDLEVRDYVLRSDGSIEP